jgi:hypothetical protein
MFGQHHRHRESHVFIGHFGVSFAVKRVAPRTSLGATFAAAQLADLVWPIFLLLGAEQVRIAPKEHNPFLTFDFVNYPWSHGLIPEIVAGAVIGGLYFAVTRYARGAIVLGLLVPSHWVIDLVVHVTDLPIYPGGAGRYGFGLWRNPTMTVIAELLVFAGGLAIYARTTLARDRIGRYGLWSLAVFLLLLYVASLGPPPPTVKALAWTALIGWPLTLWPWWVDRHRTAKSENN